MPRQRFRHRLLAAIRDTSWLSAMAWGALLSALLLSLYLQLPTVHYVDRDDGVITLSHARNFVDFGTIGVDPSGARVEGFSSPVQFWLYYAAYGLTSTGFSAFNVAQTFLCTLGLGLLFGRLLTRSRAPWWTTAGLVLLAVFLLSRVYSFLGWHASGMENPLVHLFFVATVLLLYDGVRTGRLPYWQAAVAALATLTRLEAIWHLGPLLLLFGAYWYRALRTVRGPLFVLLVFALWAAYHGWRYLYFGDWLPNTAYAHDIHPFERLSSMFAEDGAVLRESITLASEIAVDNGAYLVVAVLPVAVFLKRTRENTFFLAASLLLVATALLNPLLFGRTPLAPARSTTFVSAIVVMSLLFVLPRVRPGRPSRVAQASSIGLACALSLGCARAPTELCCSAERYRQHTRTFLQLAEQQGLVRPTVATPDLGKLSFQKQFNIVDLGRLGSPLMARLAGEPAVLADYFFDFAAPDFIQSHAAWSCEYSFLFRDPRFERLYEPIGTPYVSRWTRKHCTRDPESPSGYWKRRSLTDERSREILLIRALRHEVELAPIRAELDHCARQRPLTACQYVTRTVYRFSPELRARGLLDAARAEFVDVPSAPYDLARLRSGERGDWHEEALAFLRSYSRTGSEPCYQGECPPR